MTVKELIEKLKEYPEDMDVAYDAEEYFGDINDMYVENAMKISGDPVTEKDYFLVLHE